MRKYRLSAYGGILYDNLAEDEVLSKVFQDGNMGTSMNIEFTDDDGGTWGKISLAKFMSV